MARKQCNFMHAICADMKIHGSALWFLVVMSCGAQVRFRSQYYLMKKRCLRQRFHCSIAFLSKTLLSFVLNWRQAVPKSHGRIFAA